jgi:copper homeostasis protein
MADLNKRIIREVCIENGSRINELAAKKAERVELCDNLAVGGTTVSYGVAENVIARCRAAGIRVMSMIRPRGGSFVYDSDETAMMLKDIEMLRRAGTDGVVFGCLKPGGGLDAETTAKLARAAAGLDISFHMAFDAIPADEQFAAIDRLASLGIGRILTRGSSRPSSPVTENLDRLKRYIEAAAGRLIILPGGGIDKDNLESICAALGVNEAHGTRIV